jgi:hypothetical protein
MAGSYKHCVTTTGNLRSNERIAKSLENGGDVFEAIEELFGMIWWLATQNGIDGEYENPSRAAVQAKVRVEEARANYKEGLERSKRIHSLFPDNREE